MNIREIEKSIDEKVNQIIKLINEISILEDEKENYYKNQKSWCKKIKNIIKGNDNHIPFID